MATFVKVEGLQKVNRVLRALPPKLQNKPLRKALAAGGSEFAKQVRANARQIDNKATPNNISRAVSNRFSPTRTRKNGGSPVQRVTMRPTKENPVYYWNILEYGSSKMAARPFMRPAFDQSQQPATVRVSQTLEKELLKITKNL